MRLLSRVFSATLLLLPAVNAVYKDEAFQNDWHIALIGPSIPSSTFFHQPVLTARASLIYTLTTRSILAAIYPKDGSIVWRHQLGGERPLGPGIARASDGMIVTSVDGNIKAFDAVDGKLIWGNAFGQAVRDFRVTRKEVNFVVALLEDGRVVKIDAMTGDVEWETHRAEEKDNPHSLSLQDTKIFAYYLQPSKGVRIASISLDSDLLSSAIIPAYLNSSDVFYTSDLVLAWTEVSSNQVKFLVPGSKKPPTSVATPKDIVDIVFHSLGSTILAHYQAADKSWAEVYNIDVHKGTVTSTYSLGAEPGRSAFSISASGPNVYITWTFPNSKGYLYGIDSPSVLASYAANSESGVGAAVLHTVSEVIPKDQQKYAVRSFVSTSAPGFRGNTYLIHNGDAKWSRAESLVSITATAWVELLDPAAEEIAEELDVEGHKSTGGAYIHRVMRHMNELIVYGPDWIISIPGRVMDAFTNGDPKEERGGKWRDFFGFRKYIIAATKEGGLVALDTGKKGAVVWEISILSDQNTGQWKGVQQIYEIAKGVVGIVTFGGEYLEVDAFEGKILKRENIGGLVSGSTVLERGGKSKLVLVVLEGGDAAVLPSGSSLREPAYLAVRGDDRGVKGLRVTGSSKSEETWTFTPPASEEITSLVTRPPHDPVASIGKVLGDRSVMYKYINQNLLAIITASKSRSTASVYLLDSVSGTILYSAIHTGVDTTKPIVSTMSENWIVYSYYGDGSLTGGGGAKGYHLVVSELFESELPNDRGPLGKAANYSSIAGEVGRPFVASQSYVFPTEISFLGVTSTRQGITTREVLGLLPWSSSILSLPKRLLDPRRPIGRDPNEAEREEGLMKYAPVIEADSKAILNHARELIGIRKIVTTPTLLESTSLVFAYGGDLFGTRVTPSMAFDVLGKGFSKIQLVGTIVALLVGVGIVSPMVRRKQINQRWLGTG